ncbi:MAG: 6-pyruvoyl-tetrahydropterin synthase-related protein [Spongiibacteraceae bacterium]
MTNLEEIKTPTAYKVPLAFVALFIVAALACAPMLWYGAPNGHSIIYNLVWLKSFSAQLAQGDLYPRWLMDMNHGAGSPAFYFYAPLPFYLASIPDLLAPNLKLTVLLAWGEWLILALSGAAFFQYARRRYSMGVAWFCAVVYMLLPYHFEINLWRRQDIGELTNYIWMPLILYYTEKLFEGRRAFAGLAICYALMMMSHLPSALLFSIAIGCYVLVLLWFRHSWRHFPRFAIAIAVGILLAGVYWVPALTSEQYVRSEKLWTPYFDFHHWFFPLNDAPHHDINSNAFAQRLFTMVGVSTVIFSLCWLPAFRWRETIGTKKLLGCLALIGVAWFLMSPASEFVWENAPELWKVQFPWRIAMVVDLAAAIAVLHAVHCLQIHRDWFSAMALVIALSALGWGLATMNVKHKLDPFDNPWWITGRDTAVRNGLDAPEYTTMWNHSTSADTSTEIAGEEQLNYDVAGGAIDVVQWMPRDIVLQVNLQQATRLRVRQFFFPNWRATTESGEVLTLTAAPDNGLLMMDLPAGDYRVELRLAKLPQELIGTGASLAGLALLFGGVIWRNRRLAKA